MDHLCYLCLVLSCFRVCSLLPCGHLKGWADLLALDCDIYYDFVTFSFGILGQVRYLIVLIPALCCLSYFVRFTSVGSNLIIISINKQSRPCSGSSYESCLIWVCPVCRNVLNCVCML